MKPERYNAKEAEPKWQAAWDKRALFVTRDDDPRPKYYVLEMFPYPSGRIHMGHVRNYAMGDVVARYKRARGFNVLHPMGWDAFGMPAENAAMQNKVHPKEWTYANIATMRAQLKSMGLSLDWSREIATCDPAYYRHQQRLFLDFLKAGLVDRKTAMVNWDPVDQTVLANEQVIDGHGWRSGAPVEQRELTQWFFRITHFAQDPLDKLDTLERWPEKVRLMQKNWIGRSEGLSFSFGLKGAPAGFDTLPVFTTRPDTMYGPTFAPLQSITRSPERWPPTTRGWPPLSRSVDAPAHHRPRSTRPRNWASTRGSRPSPGRPDLGAFALHRKLRPDELRHGGPSSAVRPTTSATSTSPANMGSTVIDVFVPLEDGRACPRTSLSFRRNPMTVRYVCWAGRANRATCQEGIDRTLASFEQQGWGRREIKLPVRDLGHFRAALLGLPDPRDPLRTPAGVVPVPESGPSGVLRRSDFEVPGNPLGPRLAWVQVPVRSCGAPAAPRTDTMDTFVGLVLVFRPAFTRSEPGRTRRWTAKPSIPGCRSTSISAASSTRSSPALLALLHAGHEPHRPLGPWNGSLRRLVHAGAWSSTRPYRAADGDGFSRRIVRIESVGGERRAFHVKHGAPVEIGFDREDVEVEAQHVDPDDIIAASAPTRRAGSCCPTRPPSAT
jgi:leucyl-tRNA synthetase